MAGASGGSVTALWLTAAPPVAFESALADRGVDLRYVSTVEAAVARAGDGVDDSDATGDSDADADADDDGDDGPGSDGGPEPDPDAVVVDGGFDGALAAVERLAETGLPVIYLVDDDDTDEAVSAALERGATATVAEASPAAVANRVRRAVQAAEDRRDAGLFEQFLSGLHLDAGDTVFFKDEAGRFVRVSESKAREVGESRADVRGKTDFDYMSESEAQVRYEEERAIVETGDPIVGKEERVVSPDGDVYWYRVTKLPRYDADGDVVGTFGLARDITDLKELEETLAELEAVIDRVPVWLLAVDADGEVTWANDPAKRRLVGPGGDIVGRALTDLTRGGPLSSGFADRYERAVEALLDDAGAADGDGRTTDDEAAGDGTAESRHVSHEVPIEPVDGDTRICDVHVRLLPLADGAYNGAVLAFHDVTTQVEQERELQRQYERLERLVQTVSHDLRNPLQVALGHVDAAADEFDSPLVDRAADALDRMDVLVENLLSMAHEGRELEDPETVSLAAIAEEAWRPFAEYPATLAVEGDATLEGDADRLVRLFENAFRNAVEHAGEDVTVTVGPMDEGGFFVADDGPGIPPEDREAVFELGFTTSDEGTGFGLAIASEIARAHGLESRVAESDAGGARLEFVPAAGRTSADREGADGGA